MMAIRGVPMKKRIDEHFLKHEPEGECFEIKSARVKPADLAEVLIAFANTKGGTVAVGVSDKNRMIEGLSCVDDQHLRDLVAAQWDCCRPRPEVQEEYLDVVKANGKPDRVLLLHVAARRDVVTRSWNETAFVRVGDRTRELRGEALREFEYSRSERSFESEINRQATIDDLDAGLLARYKQCIGASALDTEQVLKSRSLLRVEKGCLWLTNAAVLLFAENVRQFFPHCRLRFLRYDSDKKLGGAQYNVIKDKSFDEPIPRMLDRAKEFISGQLREFTTLNADAQFHTVPEYPEFAWVEGIVNAVAHREYACMGDHIRVSMYDDRMEIESPGRLPYPVTVENIREIRRSRNPIIARVLTEMKWVRELNEGVPRMYSDMEGAFLEHPEFSEGTASVKLVLKNNIHSRRMRREDKALKSIGEDVWNSLDDLEKDILVYLAGHRDVKTRDLAGALKFSHSTVYRRLKHLSALGVVTSYGINNSPVRSYNMAGLK